MRSIVKTYTCVAVLIALSCASYSRAQTTEDELNQYKRAEWGLEQGLSSGRIEAIAQTPDGYLWIGTKEGLLRFDGIRFVPILTDQKRPLRQILGLTVDKDGILWIRAADMRLRQVQRDSIAPPISHDERVLSVVTMGAAQTAGIYATETRKTVLRLTHDRVEALPISSKSVLISITEASDHRLWIGTDRGLLSWKDGTLTTKAGRGIDKKTNCLLPDDHGGVWVGTDDGLAYWDGHELSSRPLVKPDMQHLQILTMMKDRDGNLWLGTSRGLLRYRSSGASWVTTGVSEGQTPVTALMQDREGDIWFGADSSLERLEAVPIIPIRRNDATSRTSFGPLHVDPNGRVWFADLQHGLYWIDHGVTHTVTNDGLSKDEVYSIDGEGEDVWVGRRNQGLTRLRFRNGGLESKTWGTSEGLAQNSAYVVRAASGGTVWVGTLTGGLDRFQNGRFTHYSERDGLPASDVSAIELGSQGQVWVGTSGGVCKMELLRCSPLFADRMPVSKDVLALLEDSSRGLWIGTSKGLFFADEREERQISLGPETQPRILGLGIDRTGRLWISTERGIMSAMPNELFDSRSSSIRTYGTEDGLESIEGVHRPRSIVGDGRGQVWISTAKELAVVGDRPVPFPAVIPQVEEVSVDGVALNRKDARVSPGAKRLTFSFTGLDLHAPSRVRFRYRLDNFDKNWSDVTRDREVSYTNLAPGNYTFRLMASNESNAWDSQESTVGVLIEPSLWQRWSVRYALAVGFLLLVAYGFHLRMRFLVAQVNILSEERLQERTRIARDIHDTLLQGFISSLMHLHLAERQIPVDSPLKQKVSFVLQGMERVIEEARLAVVGLRNPGPAEAGIESNLKDFFQEIADLGNSHLTLRTTGRPHPLTPEAYEHICSIAREAVLNAVRHASPRNVQVGLSWGWRKLTLSVSDDGCGMDAPTLQNGRARHWGLVGMRERAKKLKGRLRIDSRLGAGTKVSLVISAVVAYRRSGSPSETDTAI